MNNEFGFLVTGFIEKVYEENPNLRWLPDVCVKLIAAYYQLVKDNVFCTSPLATVDPTNRICRIGRGSTNGMSWVHVIGGIFISDAIGQRATWTIGFERDNGDQLKIGFIIKVCKEGKNKSTSQYARLLSQEDRVIDAISLKNDTKTDITIELNVKSGEVLLTRDGLPAELLKLECYPVTTYTKKFKIMYRMCGHKNVILTHKRFNLRSFY